MPTDRRLTQKDLARIAGVSHTTVSLALRNHPRIGAVTKERILRLAREHDYQPDATLSALNAYRVGKQKPSFRGSLVWLTNFPMRDGWRNGKQMEGYFLGACEQAKKLGYGLSEFWAADPTTSATRAARILLNRGVTGIIVAPQPNPYSRMEFDWQHFCSVTLGYSLAEPKLSLVINNQYRNIQRVVHELHKLGYSRIGLAMPAANDQRVDHNYLSGFWIAGKNYPRSEYLTPLLTDSFTARGFTRWFKAQRPDAVITATNWAGQVEEWCAQLGLQIPQDVGLAVPSIPFRETRYTGVDENVRMVGRIAVDTLVGMIHRNDKGVPEFPLRILVEGSWNIGKTASRRQPLTGIVS